MPLHRAMRKCVLHHLSFAIFYTINQPRGLSFGTILRKSLQTTLRFLNYGCSELTWGPAVRFHCRWWSEVSPGWRWVGPPACCFPRSRSPPPSAAGSPATDKHFLSFSTLIAFPLLPLLKWTRVLQNYNDHSCLMSYIWRNLLSRDNYQGETLLVTF